MHQLHGLNVDTCLSPSNKDGVKSLMTVHPEIKPNVGNNQDEKNPFHISSMSKKHWVERTNSVMSSSIIKRGTV
jgi:hypothetical protein